MNDESRVPPAFVLFLLLATLSACGGSSSGTANGGNTNNVPVASAGSDQSVNEGTGVTLDGSTSSDSDGDTLTYVWVQTGGPTVTLAGAGSAVATFTAPGTGVDISLVFELTVSDPDGATSSDSVTVAVNDVGNQAPAVEGDPAFAVAGELFGFTPVISDADGDALLLDVSNLPAWLTFNSATGELSGTPVAADIATYANITITVSDGELSTNMIFDLEVVADTLEAALKSGDHRYVTNEQTYLTAIIETIDAGIADSSLPAEAADVRTLFENFETDGFTFDLLECSVHDCPPGSAYYPEFLDIVESLKLVFDGFDVTKVDIFKSPAAYRYEKLLVLIADHYRSQVTFAIYRGYREPFLKAYYADHVVYTYRELNPAQPDLGTFSRADFSHITPETADITLVSRKDFRAAGVYALPGETVRVHRTDSSSVNTWIRVNTVLPNAVFEFTTTGGVIDPKHGYNRPKFLTSSWIPVAAGETIYFTTPHGGPVQVKFDANDMDVAFTFENVGRHPYWNGPEDSDAFMAALDADEYDWEEFSTFHFESHTKGLTIFPTELLAGDADSFNDAIVNFFIRHPYVLAGLQGENIDVEAEIHDWTAANGLDVTPIETVQHMNGDVQVSCTGSTACVGNPYQNKGTFDPYSATVHMHELGHSIEMKRRFDGWFNTHNLTDLYHHYAWFRLNEAGRSTPAQCEAIHHQDRFNILQDSVNSGDAFAYMQAQDIGADWRDGTVVMVQMMALAERNGALNTGWFLLPRMQIIEREFNAAITDDTNWAAKRSGLGFDGISRTDAQALSNNDWWLIALSHVLQLDMSDYLEMWGMTLTDNAKAHVAGFAWLSAPRVFYAMELTAHCNGLIHPELAIDGVTTWP